MEMLALGLGSKNKVKSVDNTPSKDTQNRLKKPGNNASKLVQALQEKVI
jgi:hypothetical protein